MADFDSGHANRVVARFGRALRGIPIGALVDPACLPVHLAVVEAVADGTEGLALELLAGLTADERSEVLVLMGEVQETILRSLKGVR